MASSDQLALILSMLRSLLQQNLFRLHAMYHAVAATVRLAFLEASQTTKMRTVSYRIGQMLKRISTQQSMFREDFFCIHLLTVF